MTKVVTFRNITRMKVFSGTRTSESGPYVSGLLEGLSLQNIPLTATYFFLPSN